MFWIFVVFGDKTVFESLCWVSIGIQLPTFMRSHIIGSA
jgi:hypothetical protein